MASDGAAQHHAGHHAGGVQTVAAAHAAAQFAEAFGGCPGHFALHVDLVCRQEIALGSQPLTTLGLLAVDAERFGEVLCADLLLVEDVPARGLARGRELLFQNVGLRQTLIHQCLIAFRFGVERDVRDVHPAEIDRKVLGQRIAEFGLHGLADLVDAAFDLHDRNPQLIGGVRHGGFHVAFDHVADLEREVVHAVPGHLVFRDEGPVVGDVERDGTLDGCGDEEPLLPLLGERDLLDEEGQADRSGAVDEEDLGLEGRCSSEGAADDRRQDGEVGGFEHLVLESLDEVHAALLVVDEDGDFALLDAQAAAVADGVHFFRGLTRGRPFPDQVIALIAADDIEDATLLFASE